MARRPARVLAGSLALAALILPVRAQREPPPRDPRLDEARETLAGVRRHLTFAEPGDARLAIPALEQALLLFRQAHDLEGQAETLHGLGRAHSRLGQRAAAHARYQQALAIYRQLGDLRGQSRILNPFGLLALDGGAPGEAAGLLERALAAAREAGDLLAEAEILHNLGAAHLRSGALQAALDFSHEALELHRAGGDEAGEAATLNNLGLAWAALGQPARAREHYRQALELHVDAGNPRGAAGTANNLGLIHRELGQPARAARFFRLALDRLATLEDRAGRLEVLNNLGVLHLESGDLARAFDVLLEALTLPDEPGDGAGASPRNRAALLTNLGQVYRERRQLGAARALIERALKLHRALADPWGLHHALLEQARLRRDLGRLESAAEALDEAVRILDGLRSSTPDAGHRASFGARHHEVYEFYIEILMELDRRRPGAGAEAALEVAERARARSLLEVLEKAGGRPGALFEPPRTRALTVAEIRGLLEDETLLLEYSLGEERSYLWAVTAGEIEVHHLPGRARIEPLARRLHHLLARSRERAARGPAAFAAAELAELLIAPAAHRLRRRVVTVAGGALEYVPFAVLPAGPGGRPLGLEREVVALPSASVLAALREPRWASAQSPPAARERKTLAILADPVFARDDPRLALRSSRRELPERARQSPPDGSVAPAARLPYSRREAQRVAALVPEERRLVALDFAARRELATGGALGAYRILHFATHGILDAQRPERSALLLSQFDREGGAIDGRLRLADVYRLELDAELVVLSACRTALGPTLSGEGMIGLARGFLHAGARRVLVSLWNVDDRATATLMERFYRGLLAERLSAPAALRAAQASLASEPRWSAPYYWAGFVLQGDWR